MMIGLNIMAPEFIPKELNDWYEKKIQEFEMNNAYIFDDDDDFLYKREIKKLNKILKERKDTKHVFKLYSNGCIIKKKNFESKLSKLKY